MAINVSITLNNPGRPFYAFGPYTIVNTTPTTVDLSAFDSVELQNLVDSVLGGELLVTGFTANQFVAYASGLSGGGSSGASLTGTSTTSAPTAGGASALPATPAGYLAVTINGVAHKIAYY